LEGIRESRHRGPALVALCFVIPLSIVVNSKLLPGDEPRFFYEEIWGVSYHGGVALPDLCSPNILAGLDRQTSNISGHRSTSLIFALPTKLLRHRAGVYGVHRMVMAAAYSVLLCLLAWLGFLLGLRLSATVLLVTCYGLSHHLLSHLYEFRMCLTSLVWQSWALILFVLLVGSARSRGFDQRTAMLLFLVPLTSAAAYEAYCLARPLAIVFWLGGLLWLLLEGRVRGKAALSVWLLSSAAGYSLLKALHPSMRFDQTLLTGGFEGLITHRGGLVSDLGQHVLNRLAELGGLLRPALHLPLTTLEPNWGEVIYVLLSLLLLTALCLGRGRYGSRLREQFRCHAWTWLLLLAFLLVALLTPVGSTQYVRSHRLSGFYPLLAIVTVLLADHLLVPAPRRIRVGVAAIFLATVAFVVLSQVPRVVRWQPPSRHTPPDVARILTEFGQEELPAGFRGAREGNRLLICDQGEERLFEPSWTSLLYASDFGCRIRAVNPEFSCECSELRDAICITRHPSRESGRALSIRYGEDLVGSRDRAGTPGPLVRPQGVRALVARPHFGAGSVLPR
jgi:hypothetical protein